MQALPGAEAGCPPKKDAPPKRGISERSGPRGPQQSSRKHPDLTVFLKPRSSSSIRSKSEPYGPQPYQTPTNPMSRRRSVGDELVKPITSETDDGQGHGDRHSDRRTEARNANPRHIGCPQHSGIHVPAPGSACGSCRRRNLSASVRSRQSPSRSRATLQNSRSVTTEPRPHSFPPRRRISASWTIWRYAS